MSAIAGATANRRGRPRDPARINRVLDAAATQFAAQGFAGTSMDAVAQASGVSKMTVYSYFPTKEALFACCIERRCNGLFDLFLQADLDPADPATALTRIGQAFQALMRDPEVLATHRMILGCVGSHDSACATFFAQGPLPAVAHVTRYLTAAAEAGALAIADPARAANQFLALFHGLGHLQALFGQGLPGAAADEEEVTANVALFLRAHTPAGGGA